VRRSSAESDCTPFESIEAKHSVFIPADAIQDTGKMPVALVKMISDDTIVAISSAVGPAARMIVRLSGPASFSMLTQLTVDSATPEHGTASRARLRLNNLQFPATVYAFRAPRSATGEDVIEIHLPGNPLLARMLVDASILAGARAAEPGEFTARSYFNGRLDLSAAEGVSSVIAAQSERELEAARRLLSGELSRRLRPTMDLLAQTLALVEADIDFAGEEITILDREQTNQRIDRIDVELAKLLAESARFEILSHEPRIVLVGRPNAGKSTLLNSVAGADRAIVSPFAGTTRDVLTASVTLMRGIVTLMDVAGLEENVPGDPISEQMHPASMNAVRSADVVVLVREIGDERPSIPLPVQPHLFIRSKADLSHDEAGELCVSAYTGVGLPTLRDRLDSLAFGPVASNASLALNARHIRSIDQARSALARAAATTEPELIALELRDALDAMGEILGSVTPDDVLGRIFSSFCIGK
jgi:tRNA modification GTPase